jgi:hypothetical protein
LDGSLSDIPFFQERKMRNKIITLFSSLILFGFSGAAMADQLMGGFGFPIQPGEPDFESDRIMVSAAFELQDQWRFSFTDGDFEHKDDSDIEIQTQVFGAEKLWFHKLKDKLALVGGLGAGLFSVDTEPGGSGVAFGLLATGSARFAINDKIFIDAALHYRNAAVKVDSDSVNGGYQGIVVSGGYKF